MLSHEHRITSAIDYRRTVRGGERVRGRHYLGHVQVLDAGAVARFGFIVSKSVGIAHTRNLVRRRLKAIAYELIANGMISVDVVFRAHPSSATATYSELRQDVLRGAEQIRVFGEKPVKAAAS